MFLTVSPAAFAQGAAVEIGSGTVDHDRIEATRWTRINFTPSIAGTHTIRVSWNNDADIRFTLFRIVNAPAPNNRVEIASGSGTVNLQEVTENLSDSEQYYLGVWAAEGSAAFTATIEEETVVADPLEIVSQPADQTVTEGEDAIFTVVASGSGTLSYQWFESNTAINGAITDTLTISPASLVDSGNSYSVVISDDNGSITSASAILTVDEDIQSPVTPVTFGTGILDSEKVTGPSWVQVDFDSLGTATHTIAVSWDSDADVRFNVFESDGTRISSSTVKGSNPGVWVGELNANEQYYIGLWSSEGIANYIATVAIDTDTPDPLEIITQPADLTLTEGEDAIFTVTATGSGALDYQWFADATEINGAISDTLTISPAVLSDSGTAYTVVINDDNGSITSDAATLTVNEIPVTLTITEQPADLTITEGEDAIFTVAANGSGALSYQWFASTTETLEDNTLIINPAMQIPDATSDTLLVSSVTLADSLSTYSVVVNDDNGSLTSDMAMLIVDEAPITVSITSQPTDLSVTEGEDAVFTVVANGSGTLSYQWFANNIAISGATDDTLTISPTSLTDSGTAYSVVVNDDNGSITSDTVTLTVNEVLPPLVITEQPVDLTVTEGQDAAFSITATGSGALSYQWFANTVAITGATEDTLTLSPTTLADTGTGYSVVVTDDNGSIDSEIAILVVVEEVVLPVSLVEIGQGTLDSEKNVGPRWVRIDFNSLATAMHTITVSWDSDADVKFNVFSANNGLISSQTVQGVNPGIWAGELNANEQYYIALWSTNGIANYTATIEANVPVAIESQPLDLIVTEGENATFTVAASGSGTLSYQWFADGVALPGENGDSLTVFATSLAEDGTGYTVDVDNSVEVVTSDMATLTVNEPVILGLFSQEADTSTWVLDGPAPTLDFQAGEDTLAWGRVLLRVGDVLLVGGDFEGIKPTRTGPLTERPWLAAFSAISGQPVSSFQVPFQVDSVVRSLVLSPNGDQVYVGGDFGLLVLDAITGELDIDVSVSNGDEIGRVFDIAVTQSQVYIGGDFSHVDNTFRANIARLSLNGELDLSWSPNVTNGFSNGRSAPVQALAVSTSGDTVYVGGNFGFIEGVAVDTTPQNGKISLLAVSAIDETVKAERFSADVNNNNKALQVHDIAVTDSYVIVAWGGPNFLTFHSLAGDRLEQYRAKGDVQALQIVGNHVFVGHHGEFFGTFNNPVPQEAVISIDPEIVEPFKMHSFRIDDPSFPVEQAWQISGAFGIWGIAAAEDSIWLAGQVFRAGSNEHLVDGLVKFPALD